jgi:hypothetical protein
VTTDARRVKKLPAKTIPNTNKSRGLPFTGHISRIKMGKSSYDEGAPNNRE